MPILCGFLVFCHLALPPGAWWLVDTEKPPGLCVVFVSVHLCAPAVGLALVCPPSRGVALPGSQPGAFALRWLSSLLPFTLPAAGPCAAARLVLAHAPGSTDAGALPHSRVAVLRHSQSTRNPHNARN